MQFRLGFDLKLDLDGKLTIAIVLTDATPAAAEVQSRERAVRNPSDPFRLGR